MWNRKAVVSEEVVTFLKKNGILEDGKEQRLIKKSTPYVFNRGSKRGGFGVQSLSPILDDL